MSRKVSIPTLKEVKNCQTSSSTFQRDDLPSRLAGGLPRGPEDEQLPCGQPMGLENC